MKKKVFHPGDGSKSGVALIIVLGFLSIMIIMALAFLTQTRTERMVADVTLEAQRGRQLVRTGLTAAMNDYSIELDKENLLLPPTNTPAGDDLTVFSSIPPTSLADMHQTLGQSRVRLMAGEARQWIPRRYLTPAVSNLVDDAEWIMVRENPTKQSRIVGRYAYVCFDMSGGIDANLIAQNTGVANVGNATNRFSIRAVGMGELPETANAGVFKTLRNGWKGFDNLSELILLTNGKYNGGEGKVALTYKGVKYAYSDEADPDIEDVTWLPPSVPDQRWKGDKVEWSAGLISSKVSDLVPYSLAAYRGVYDTATAKWSAPEVCDDTANWTQVLDPVKAQLANLPDTVKAIEDYLDTDSLPQGAPDYPSSEAIPMLNELGINLDLALNGAAPLVLSVGLEYETWYPFPSPDNPGGEYTIQGPEIAGGFTPAGAGDVWIRCAIQSASGNKLVDLTPTFPLVAQLNVSAAFDNDPESQGIFQYEIPIVLQDTTYVLDGTEKFLIQFIKSQNPIEMWDGTTPADQMMFDVPLSIMMIDGGTYSINYEVDDPRLNHDISRWTEGPSGGTMGDINDASTATGYKDPGGEGLYMYCRNEAMQSPAELGFISTGNPWETIDLCTEEGAEMMSELVSDPAILAAVQSAADNNTFYTNATINPNTGSTNVLMAAFTGLNRREVPNAPDMPGPDDGPLMAEDAGLLAADMIFESKTKEIKATGGAFMSGSAWARVPSMQKGGALAGGGGGGNLPSGMAPLNKNQREALIRNTWGLFSPNNSLFTVVMIGQAIKEGPGQVGDWDPDEDMITGERRGVALVWRDPLPSTGGFHHEMFVRMFKFLDE